MKYFIYLVGAGLVVAAIAIAYFIPKTQTPKSTNIQTPVITFEETEYDFGRIKQSGGIVKHDFAFTYNGKIPRIITATPASCACTSGSVDKRTLQPGERGTLTVAFDPNLHAEPPGRFFKTVAVTTDPPLPQEAEVKIWTEIDLDLGPEAFELSSRMHDDDKAHEQGKPFHTIDPSTLDNWLKTKELTLIDVHIPEQEHIPGTDQVIAFNSIQENSDQLPIDKDAPVVVYCRSGSMSQQAATTLTQMGYTDVYHLAGGIQAYNQFTNQQ